MQRPEGNPMMDAQLVALNLSSLIKQLKSEKAWKKSDRNSITVFKSAGISTVLTALHKGTEMAKHTTEGMISVQILKGKCTFKTTAQSVKLERGSLLELKAGIPHSLEAKKTTIFLLTITFAAGHNGVSQVTNTTLEQDNVNGMSVIRETI